MMTGDDVELLYDVVVDMPPKSSRRMLMVEPEYLAKLEAERDELRDTVEELREDVLRLERNLKECTR